MGSMSVLVFRSVQTAARLGFQLGAVENITNPIITTQYKVIVNVSEAVVDQERRSKESSSKESRSTESEKPLPRRRCLSINK